MELFKIVWKYLKGDRVKIVFVGILTFIGGLFPLVYPYFWAKILSALMSQDFHMFLVNLLCWSGLAIVSELLFELPRDVLYHKAEVNFVNRLSTSLYNKTLNLPARAFEKFGSGEIVNRVFNDPVNVMGTTKLFIRFVSNLVMALFMIIYIVSLSPILAIELLVFCTFIFCISKFYKPKVKKFEKDRKGMSDSYLKFSTQTFLGIREIRALGIKNEIKEKVKSNLYELGRKVYGVNMTSVKYSRFLLSGFFILEFIILFTSGVMYFNKIILFESFVLISSYIGRLLNVLEFYSDFGVELEKLKVSLNRMFEILDNKLYKDVEYGSKSIDNIEGNIEFKNVTFGYEEDDILIRNLNLSIPTKKKVAIVGKSGGGKSTIFNLLLRYFDPLKGSIRIDGINLSDLTEESLNSYISIIRQDPFLFNMSIMDNFRLVKSNITLEEAREVCKKAFIDEYIMNLKDGYDTVIGEGGVNLSGGQKQRLAIARALIKDSKIILFDEATSALDNISQAYIKETIDSLSKERTVVIIAHRLSTIEDADEIIVINEGKVKAKGTHNELIKSNDIYKELYVGESNVIV